MEPRFSPSPIYTEAERESVWRVNGAMERVVRSTPNPMPPIELLKLEPDWIDLVDKCRVALVAFNARGRSVEDA